MISSPRRMFLHTAALALPSATLGLAFSSDAGAEQPANRSRRDPVLQEVLRQVKAATKAATKPGVPPTGESLRQLANALRVLAAHGSTIGLDASISRGLRSLGRKNILTHRPDLAALETRLRAEGIDADLSRLAPTPDDPSARAAALDRLLTNGASASFVAIAQAFDDSAARLDKQRGAVQLINSQGANCGQIFWDLFMLEVAMFAACGPWAIAVWEACVVAAAAYFTMKATACYVWGCC